MERRQGQAIAVFPGDARLWAPGGAAFPPKVSDIAGHRITEQERAREEHRRRARPPSAEQVLARGAASSGAGTPFEAAVAWNNARGSHSGFAREQGPSSQDRVLRFGRSVSAQRARAKERPRPPGALEKDQKNNRSAENYPAKNLRRVAAGRGRIGGRSSCVPPGTGAGIAGRQRASSGSSTDDSEPELWEGGRRSGGPSQTVSVFRRVWGTAGGAPTATGAAGAAG